MVRLLIIFFSSFFLQVATALDQPKVKGIILNHYTCQSVVHQPSLTPNETKPIIYYSTYYPVDDSTSHAGLKRKAKWSRWLGLGSLAGLIIPVVGLLSIPAAVVSLIFASQVKRQTTDPALLKDAKSGKQTSIATLAIIAVSIVLVVAVVALLAYRFR